MRTYVLFLWFITNLKERERRGVGGGGRRGGRERERQRGGEGRQTDIQRQRQTEPANQTDRETDRQTDIILDSESAKDIGFMRKFSHPATTESTGPHLCADFLGQSWNDMAFTC